MVIIKLNTHTKKGLEIAIEKKQQRPMYFLLLFH